MAEALNRLLNYLHVRLEFGGEIEYRVENQYRVFVLPGSPSRLLDRPNFKQEMIWDILHEVGHLVIAPPSRRNRKDYGTPPSSRGQTFWDKEDDMATLVEIELCKLFKLPPRVNPKPHLETAGVRAWWQSKGRKLAQRVYKRSQSDFNPKWIRDWAIE